MEKRIILFLVISLGIILGYDMLLKELGLLPEPVPVEEQQSEGPAGGPASPPVPTEMVAEESGNNTTITKGQSERGLDPVPSAETVEEIETSLYRVSLSSRGGQIRSWKLKHYLSQDGDDPQPIELVYPEGNFAGPLSVQGSDPSIGKLLQTGLYEVSRDFESLSPSTPTGTLTYLFRDEETGVAVKKELTFHDDSYLVDVVIETYFQGKDSTYYDFFSVAKLQAQTTA